MAAPTAAALRTVLAQLDAIQAGAGNGVLELPGGERLDLTNLGKPFWPTPWLTKGDLLRHYVRVAPYILPALDGRPLVMKRYPNGITGQPFYQHRAPDRLPAGVRVAMVDTGHEQRPHIIGGSLKTLLYTAQLASISQDPWLSRVGSIDEMDHVAIDLDPPEDLPFTKVLEVALWVRDELNTLGVTGFAKTSGAGGVHVYVPLASGTPYAAGFIFANLIAARVAEKHPKAATLERTVSARGRRVYVDYMQNVLGKTLASVYSPRANDFAGVSTPLTWDEVEAGVSPQDFTIRTFAERLKAVGDLWAAMSTGKGVHLDKITTKVDKSATTKATKSTQAASTNGRQRRPSKRL